MAACASHDSAFCHGSVSVPTGAPTSQFDASGSGTDEAFRRDDHVTAYCVVRLPISPLLHAGQ